MVAQVKNRLALPGMVEDQARCLSFSVRVTFLA